MIGTTVVGGDFSWDLNAPDWKIADIAGDAVLTASSMKQASTSLTRSRAVAYYARPDLAHWQ
jgi:hypothetical protein